jgi:ABC-type nitrate/sulfonate/bicarbonate transport system permease component
MTASVTATRIGSIALIATLILLWWLAAISGVLPRAFFPNPVDAFQEAADGLLGGDLGPQVAATVLRMIQGWLLAGLVGVALGAMIGISTTVRAYLQPTLEFLRPLPASAVIPIAISILGLSPSMALSVIIFGSIWPTLLSTVHGFATVDVRLREVAHCYRMSPLQFIYKIGIPNALPDIFGLAPIAHDLPDPGLRVRGACQPNWPRHRDPPGSAIVSVRRTIRGYAVSRADRPSRRF